ncbi:hypothetical protein [Hyphomicrobium sp. CS1GBMeth3]|uniref:hypothetical protein n=1 Tax=Hyphomicrobium sp. CS1GBMeth3 TaxID=1892845 RepID=UPI0011147477|nr:hypothetical protein [Hyphomicrobium sp. CS1GBMeth3]
MADETTDFSFLLSGSVLLLALIVFYIARALWIARHEWGQCRADTKILYLLVAPLLTLGVDVLTFTDRLFWSRNEKDGAQSPQMQRRPAPQGLRTLRTTTALRSDG